MNWSARCCPRTRRCCSCAANSALPSESVPVIRNCGGLARRFRIPTHSATAALLARSAEGLRAESISVLDDKGLTGDDRAWLRQLFVDRLLPVLIPIAIDPAHPCVAVDNAVSIIVLDCRCRFAAYPISS